jgi:hypothetical protein
MSARIVGTESLAIQGSPFNFLSSRAFVARQEEGEKMIGDYGDNRPVSENHDFVRVKELQLKNAALVEALKRAHIRLLQTTWRDDDEAMAEMEQAIRLGSRSG